MPYVAQRKFTMYGQGFAQAGNAYDLPHVVPAELVERMPTRSLNNMLSRGSIKQVEAVPVVTAGSLATGTDPYVPAADIETDPRVINEGHGWWMVAGKRVHGRVKAGKRLNELGG